MQLRTAVLALSIGASSLAAQQQSTRVYRKGVNVDETIAASNQGAVVIRINLGSVRVIGWTKDSVQVEGTIGTGVMMVADSVVLSRTPERGVRISTMLQSMNALGGAAELTVHVPLASDVTVDGHQTAITVSGVTGKLNLVANVDGVMRVSGEPAELDAYVGGSDMILNVVTPYLRARTATGRLTWTGSSDDVSLTTVSGLLTAKVTQVRRGRFETTSGDIHYVGGVAKSASISMESNSGDIVAEFTKATNAEVIGIAAVADFFGSHFLGSPSKTDHAGTVIVIGDHNDRSSSVRLRTLKGHLTARIIE
jgi:hypothetical protein